MRSGDESDFSQREIPRGRRLPPTLQKNEGWGTRPFGDGQQGSGPDLGVTGPDHFTGQELDSESNLTRFLFRQYSSAQGRWMAPDPAGLGVAGPSNPQSWNRYSYVANSPVNANDPDGLVAQPGDPGESLPSLCVVAGCGQIWDEFGWGPMPHLPPPRAIAIPLGLGILPGESSLNWPLGPSPSQILSDILTGNFTDLLGIDTSNCNPICDAESDGAFGPAFRINPAGIFASRFSSCYDGFHATPAGRVVEMGSLVAATPAAKGWAWNATEFAAVPALKFPGLKLLKWIGGYTGGLQFGENFSPGPLEAAAGRASKFFGKWGVAGATFADFTVLNTCAAGALNSLRIPGPR